MCEPVLSVEQQLLRKKFTKQEFVKDSFQSSLYFYLSVVFLFLSVSTALLVPALELVMIHFRKPDVIKLQTIPSRLLN
jgi:hypothetical protein